MGFVPYYGYLGEKFKAYKGCIPDEIFNPVLEDLRDHYLIKDQNFYKLYRTSCYRINNQRQQLKTLNEQMAALQLENSTLRSKLKAEPRS